MPNFFSGNSAFKVVEREKLPHSDSMGYRVSMFLVVKNHRNDYQVAYDCSQRTSLREVKLSFRLRTKDRLDFGIPEFGMPELTDLSVSEEFSRGGRFL